MSVMMEQGRLASLFSLLLLTMFVLGLLYHGHPTRNVQENAWNGVVQKILEKGILSPEFNY